MIPSRIRIRNLHRAHILNEAFIKDLIMNILKILKKPRDTELEVIFLNDDSMRTLNRRYKDRDRSTDVLSFKIDLEEFSEALRKTASSGKPKFLGEIFISLDTAFKNTRVFRTSFEEEIVLYIIHAVLHIFGYKDDAAGERLKMSKRENDILDRLCERHDLSKVLMPR